ncbi:MAG: hypothetical protein ACKOUM_08485 [Sphingopyxis sp.]
MLKDELKGPGAMIGKLVGAALGGTISKKTEHDPLLGAAIGAVSMVVAKRLLPARLATIGAAVAAGYVTRKLAQRAERVGTGSGQSTAPASGGATGSAASASTGKPAPRATPSTRLRRPSLRRAAGAVRANGAPGGDAGQ